MLKKRNVKAQILSYGIVILVPSTYLMKGAPVYLSAASKPGLVLSWSKKVSDSSLRPETINSTAMYAAHPPKVEMNRHAVRFVKKFLNRDQEELNAVKQISAPYFATIESVFKTYGLPAELKYLAVVESNLKSNALSRVGARGAWQLMPSLARDMGLKVSAKYDERKSLTKSTVAAAKYLRSLYAEFGDWLLVLAAYNSGSGTVHRAIRNSGSRNFWVLQSFLPQESSSHVKRFISIHYFFEGNGSVTTLTKAEAAAYMKEVKDFAEKMNRDENITADSSIVMNK